MDSFELMANDIEIALRGAKARIESFGYNDTSSSESNSRVVGMFITWITATEEDRLGAFALNVINALPVNDDPNWDSYIEPKPIATLRQRAESLCGIRIAYTHSDGDISKISNQNSQNFAHNAPQHLPGVSLNGNQLMLTDKLYHTAIRTIVQLRAVLP